MAVDTLDLIFKMDQKQAKIDDYLANLKDNPKQVSQFKKQVVNAGLDPIETTSILGEIPKLKEKGYIIDDIPITWDEHKANTPKGHLAIPLSEYKQLSGDDFTLANSVKLCFYDDAGGHSAEVTHYSANNGLDVSCGYNNNPSGTKIVQIDPNNPDDVAKFNKAPKFYDHTMKKLESRKKDILDGRGGKYEEWFPLPQSIVDKENAVIEKQQRAEYKAWQKVQENESRRPKAKDTTNWNKTPHRRYLNK